jgi:hypothetical protein
MEEVAAAAAVGVSVMVVVNEQIVLTVYVPTDMPRK